MLHQSLVSGCLKRFQKITLLRNISIQHVLEVKIVKEMRNGCLYIEDIPKKLSGWGYLVDMQEFISVMPKEGHLYAA